MTLRSSSLRSLLLPPLAGLAALLGAAAPVHAGKPPAAPPPEAPRQVKLDFGAKASAAGCKDNRAIFAISLDAATGAPHAFLCGPPLAIKTGPSAALQLNGVDARRDTAQGDWAPGLGKAQCKQTEFIANLGKGTGPGGIAATCRDTTGESVMRQTICAYRSIEKGDSRAHPERTDWDPGFVKAECDEEEHIAGISTSPDKRIHSVLCCRNFKDTARHAYPLSEQTLCPGRRALVGLSISATAPHSERRILCSGEDDRLVPTVTHEMSGPKDLRDSKAQGDWDPGYYKWQCAQGAWVSGLTTFDPGDSTVANALCRGAGDQPPKLLLQQSCTVVAPTGADARESAATGDWDVGHWKAECGEGKYVAGISRSSGVDPGTTGATWFADSPHGLLCCAADATAAPQQAAPPPVQKRRITVTNQSGLLLRIVYRPLGQPEEKVKLALGQTATHEFPSNAIVDVALQAEAVVKWADLWSRSLVNMTWGDLNIEVTGTAFSPKVAVH